MITTRQDVAGDTGAGDSAQHKLAAACVSDGGNWRLDRSWNPTNDSDPLPPKLAHFSLPWNFAANNALRVNALTAKRRGRHLSALF
jgi:hypothetical protein